MVLSRAPRDRGTLTHASSARLIHTHFIYNHTWNYARLLLACVCLIVLCPYACARARLRVIVQCAMRNMRTPPSPENQKLFPSRLRLTEALAPLACPDRGTAILIYDLPFGSHLTRLIAASVSRHNARHLEMSQARAMHRGRDPSEPLPPPWGPVGPWPFRRSSWSAWAWAAQRLFSQRHRPRPTTCWP